MNAIYLIIGIVLSLVAGGSDPRPQPTKPPSHPVAQGPGGGVPVPIGR